MKTRTREILISLTACYLLQPCIARGQQLGDLDRLNLQQITWPVAGQVKNLKGDPVPGAMVSITPVVGQASRTLFTSAIGRFQTDYLVNLGRTPDFPVMIEVRKKGFRPAHAYVDFILNEQPEGIALTLVGVAEVAGQLSSENLIKALGPRLRQLGPGEGLAAKSENDYARGTADFLDHRKYQEALPRLDKVAKGNPTCIRCRTMLGLAQWAWCDWDNGANTLALAVNASARDGKMASAELYVAYGTWLNWHHQPEKAEPFFQQALDLAPQDPLALQEFGRTLLLTKQFEVATGILEKALAAGAGPDGQLLDIKSWLGMGRPDEAAGAMHKLLGGRDPKDMSAEVRAVYAEIQEQQAVQALYAQDRAPTGKSEEKMKGRVDFLQHPPDDLVQGLEPAKDQQPLDSILDHVGLQIVELVKNFPNTTSLELIRQEKLARKGKVHGEQRQKFRYLCLAPQDPMGPAFGEYRSDLSGIEAFPSGLAEGFMLTKGFATSELIFHPLYRSESTFRYLGRQDVDGRHTFVVAYAQIPGRARFVGAFQKGNTSFPTLTQGLAWIDSETYHVLRLHTDLLAPLAEIRLQRETLNVDFGDIHFSTVPDAVWLPQKVTVTLDWNRTILRNQHEYSQFEIFNVGSSEKIGKPKDLAGSPPPREAATRPQ